MDQAFKLVSEFLKLSKFTKTLKTLSEEIEEKKPLRIPIKECIQFNRKLIRKLRKYSILPKNKRKKQQKRNKRKNCSIRN